VHLLASLLAEVTKQHILETLRECGGNRTWAARALGLSLRGLRLKLRQYERAGHIDLSEISDHSFDRFDLLPSPIAVLDYAGFIVSTNAAWQRTALTRGLGRPSSQLNYFAECDAAAMRGCADAVRVAKGLKSITNDEADRFNHIYESPFDGNFHWYQLEAVSSHARGVVVVHTNIDLLEYDTETNLPNRRLFEAQTKYCFDGAAGSGQLFCMCVVTLTNTSRSDSIFGEEITQQAIQEMARSLRACIGRQGFLARSGPAEFAILWRVNEEDAASITQVHLPRLITVLKEPIIIGPHITGITSTAGFSWYPADGRDCGRLFAAARANEIKFSSSQGLEQRAPFLFGRSAISEARSKASGTGMPVARTSRRGEDKYSG
jgi:GGDEF domain-containing protein